ncbi:hypothetical protein [Sphingobium sp. BHU LFT2]|uniref:hypothetical protein n=1 Tax=Sphingobium sp. BHU LFT2 TaxID=2807634 RepID=UPI0020363ACE|nr:hypothetical protein [Sphingobium sp. BHU LFT2]
MMYKVFAGGTLVVAPMIVLALQNFAPHHQPIAQPSEAQPVATPVAPPPPPVAPGAPQDFAVPSSGEPMADAGQPSIMPQLDTAASVSPGSSDSPPPGSPNAEH